MKLLVAVLALTTATAGQPAEPYLSWSADQARKIAESARVSGQVGRSLTFRGLATDRSFNYKLRATWMTPEVIRATARLLQLSQRLTDEQTRKLVSDAEAPGGTVVMVELDPREGSGVIPRDWLAVLQPKDNPSRAVTGRDAPELRDLKALAGAYRRDYNYDVFWVAFPLSPFLPEDRQAELLVRIYDKEGKVRWPLK